MDSYVIGVDIGGTGTKYGIVDKDGNVLHSSSMATNTHEQVHTYIDELYEKFGDVDFLIEFTDGKKGDEAVEDILSRTILNSKEKMKIKQ